ncbi:MAG: DUF4091 domain-containing protein [Phycisphaerae bacterium]|nr:DUF4091 domain-containing protein [Phycisphaerae bacterium]
MTGSSEMSLRTIQYPAMKLCYRFITVTLGAILASGLLGGCVEPIGGLNAWVASEMVNVSARTKAFEDNSVFDPAAKQVKLFSAGNETVSFQVVIDTGKWSVGGMKVRCGNLKSAQGREINADNVSVFRARAVRITNYPPWYLRLVDTVPGPADYYDALVDLGRGGRFANVKASDRAVLWVDLHVPRNTVGGKYSGRMDIRSDTHKTWSVNIGVDVYGFVLPDAKPLIAVGGFDNASLYKAFVKHEGKAFIPVRMNRKDPRVRKGLVIMRQLMRLGRAHRLDLFDKGIRPVMRRDMFGKIAMDFEDYDAIVTPYLDGTAFEDGIGCAAWPLPISTAWPLARYYGGPAGDLYATTIGAVAAEGKKHFSASPAHSMKMFYWPYRGEIGPAGYLEHSRLSRIVRAADRDTPILSQLPAAPPALTGWKPPKDFASLSDIHAARAEYFDPTATVKVKDASHPLTGSWLAPGTVPYLPSLGIIATPADVRAIPWFAMKYNCSGLFLPEVLHWSAQVFAEPAGAQTRLFYPGKSIGVDAVIPSIRLKRLRRGLQDIAYLGLMKQHKRHAAAASILNGMTRYAGLAAAGDNYLDPRLDGWVQNPETWRMARRLLAEEIYSAVRGESADPNRQLLAQRIAWKLFDEKAHSIRVQQSRSRVARIDKTNDMKVAVLLELYNEHTRNVDVVVSMNKLPTGWKALKSEVRISPFKPGESKTVELTARCRYIPAGQAGKMTIPVTITTDVSREKTIDATVSLIVAGQANNPIRIDGGLKDWPMRQGNSCAKFKLIGRRGRRGDGLAQRQTMAFVLRDARNLYVAFRCTEPEPGAMVVKPNNIVHYEQLMACGEDMVELILDPGAKANGAQELYHIVVKPNGVLLAQRGVRSHPPLGKSAPWPAEIQLAVARHEKLWVVEMAIPLSSIPEAEGKRFWGINFTRFATQGCEASSWSEAPRYFYDPRNLGTMFLPPLQKP